MGRKREIQKKGINIEEQDRREEGTKYKRIHCKEFVSLGQDR
jgi:hypothetical protein